MSGTVLMLALRVVWSGIDLAARGFKMSEAEQLLPVVYRYHVFCCFQQRPPGHPRGSCAAHGGGPLWERLSQLVQARQLLDVSMTPSGCLGFCDAGPLMVVYPQGVWYQPKTTDDIDEIVQKHFVDGELVERLAVVLRR